MSILSQVPLAALSAETRHLISILLNPPKVIPTYTRLPRDWRGLAQECSIEGEIFPSVAADPDPSNRILNLVQKKSQDFTLQSLRNALEKIDRWDIVEDSESLLEKDAKLYLERLEKSQSTAEKNDLVADAKILTLDDQLRIERGEETQQYHAFLLYADEDADFAFEIVDYLEKQNNLKLCLKDRDLIPGITFEHTAIMTLIQERCNRLIAVLSPEFLNSPANQFFLNFAQATVIDKQQTRKIIPCVYKYCEIPPSIQYFSKIYYQKLLPKFFWDKLVCSVRAAPNFSSKAETPKIAQKEENAVNENAKVEEYSSGEASKFTSPIKKPKKIVFPWKQKGKNKINEVSNSNEESTKSATTEAITSFPTLDGLDSLSSITGTTNATKKSKKKKKFIGNMQALFTKPQ